MIETRTASASTRVPEFYELVRADLERLEGLLRQAVVRGGCEELASALLPVVGGGGKRFRPVCSLLVGKLVRSRRELGENESRSLDGRLVAVAAGVEALHTASLIHDDIIDRASMRRHQPTINHTSGDSLAVLAGDYMYGVSLHLCASSDDIRVMKIYAQTVLELSSGESNEILHRPKSDVDVERAIEHYFRVIRTKTASLVGAACEMGALAAGGTNEEARLAREYGEKVGLALQIVDDILDIVQDGAILGKDPAADLREGVLTLPVLYALSDPEVKREELSSVFENGAATPAGLAKALAAIRASRGARLSRDRAEVLAREARACLAPFPENEYRRALEVAADYIVRRNA